MDMTQEQRIEVLAQPRNIEISIHITDAVAELLTSKERNRLYPKLEMVKQLAAKMAAAMVKGTIKYTENEDEKSLRSWLEHLQSELIDGSLYVEFALQRLGDGQN